MMRPGSDTFRAPAELARHRHGGDGVDGANNHSPRAVFDDAVLPDGALLHAQLAVRALRRDAAA